MKWICEDCPNPCYLSFEEEDAIKPGYCPYTGKANWVKLGGEEK